MLSKEEIETKIHSLSIDILGFNIDNYLKDKNRQICGVLQKRNKYSLLFFSEIPGVMDFLSLKDEYDQSNIVASYSAFEVLKKASKNHFKTKGVKIVYPRKVDIFILDKLLLTKKHQALFDVIVIHELCHLVCDAHYYSKINLKYNGTDKEAGAFLADCFQEVNSNEKMHHKKFCSLLCAALRKYDNKLYPSSIFKAIQFNFGGNVDIEKKFTKKYFISSIKKIYQNVR